MRLFRLTLCVLLASFMSACGPKTIVSMFFPDRYSVESTVDFTASGGVMRQTLRGRCTHIDQSDSIAANSVVRYAGEHHWLKRPDGSLLVMGDLRPCRFWQEGRTRTRQSFLLRDGPGAYSQESLLFNDTHAPTRVDFLSTNRLMNPAFGFVTDGEVRLVDGRDRSKGLRDVFPALDMVIERGGLDRGGVMLNQHGFAGLRISVFSAPKALDCGAPSASGLQRLDPQSSCRRAIPCSRAWSFDRCDAFLGAMDVQAASNFDRLTIDSRQPPNPARTAVLWPNELIASRSSRRFGERAWLPDICIDDICADGREAQAEPDDREVVVYDPRRGLLIETRPIGMQFGSFDFFGEY